jgi:hypothetical protein
VNLRIIAIRTEVAETVRRTSRSPRYGHPAHTEVAKGYGPCRHCLRYFAVGEEERILFTYDAFEGVESLPLPGPVFIHTTACPRYEEEGGFPTELLAHPLTLTAYGTGRAFREELAVAGGPIDLTLKRLLARPDVDYVLVSDREAGCFDFRIERGQVDAAAANDQEFSC